MTDKAENKIEVFPINGSFTPEVMLAKAQESLSEIKSAALVIEWDDDTSSVSWSTMKHSKLSFLLMSMQEEVRREIFGDQ